MADLIEEVIFDNKEIRKIHNLKRAMYIIAIVTLIIIATMLIVSHNNNTKTLQMNDASDKLADIFILKSSKDGDIIIKILDEVIAKNNLATSDLAMLAKSQLSANDNHSRIEAIAAVAANAKKPITRQYAKLIWMSIFLDSNDNILIANNKERFAIFAKSFEDKDSPFFGYAAILRALVAMKHDQDYSYARKIANDIISNKDLDILTLEQANAILANIDFIEEGVK